MALLPVAWLGVLATTGRQRGALWWTVGLAFSLSWVADTAAHWLDPWLVSRVYPLAQALVVGVVLLPADRLWRLLGVLALTAVLTLSTTGPDVLAHTVAWTGIVAIVWPPTDAVRRMTAFTFVGLWLGWVAYTIAPTWATWGVYQGLRAVGLGMFCWASAPARVRV